MLDKYDIYGPLKSSTYVLPVRTLLCLPFFTINRCLWYECAHVVSFCNYGLWPK